jgi:hypothetical protein
MEGWKELKCQRSGGNRTEMGIGVSKDMVVGLMNSKTFCINKMQGSESEGGVSCQIRRLCKRWPEPEILRTRRSKQIK